MPLLDSLLEKRIRQIDFECIREDKEVNPQRLVAFGEYAGIAGAFDFIRGIGEFLLQKLYQTPFIFIGSSYMYPDYSSMQQALSSLSQTLSKNGYPSAFAPLVFAVTGTGRVAKGVMKVLEQLPHVRVQPEGLKGFKSEDNKKIVICNFTSEHLVRHKKGLKFDKKDYYAHANNYES